MSNPSRRGSNGTARTVSSCGMAAALSVVIMLLGGVLGLGMYASPMIAGVCLIPIGREFGRKYHVTLWLAVSFLCFILVPNVEENLMYLTLFGLYPILYPYFQRLRGALRWVCKLLYFNITSVAVEALVVLVLVPEVLGGWMIAALLAMGNITFILYDFLIPRFETLLRFYLGKLKGRR